MKFEQYVCCLDMSNKSQLAKLNIGWILNGLRSTKHLARMGRPTSSWRWRSPKGIDKWWEVQQRADRTEVQHGVDYGSQDRSKRTQCLTSDEVLTVKVNLRLGN